MYGLIDANPPHRGSLAGATVDEGAFTSGLFDGGGEGKTGRDDFHHAVAVVPSKGPSHQQGENSLHSGREKAAVGETQGSKDLRCVTRIADLRQRPTEWMAALSTH